ncbi:MAG: hypothetical protein GXP34_09945 [Actinobacteria bacterium]|nr:hypothetical protein [Actinomycetota bacterium]
MKGCVAAKGDRWYAVIYEGLDPVTGKERRTWHPAGTNRQDAERLAARLAREVNGRNDEGRALTFGAYLTTRWLPGKKLELASSIIGARSTGTSSPPSAGSRSVDSDPITSRRCMTPSCIPPTRPVRWHRRRCWRSIS